MASPPISKKGVVDTHVQERSSVDGRDLSPTLTEEPVTMAMVTLVVSPPISKKGVVKVAVTSPLL